MAYICDFFPLLALDRPARGNITKQLQDKGQYDFIHKVCPIDNTLFVYVVRSRLIITSS